MEKRFYFLYFTVFFNILGLGISFPVFPLLAQKLNANSFDIGLLSATIALSQLFFAPILGKISDRFGRKPILLFSVLTSSVSMLLIGNSTNILFLYLSMLLLGLSNAGVFPISTAYIADITKGDTRSLYISRVTGTFALGFMIGPALGGLLSTRSLTFPFFIAFFITLINAFLLYFFLTETHHKRDTTLAIKEGLFNFKPLISGLKGEFGSLFIILFAWSFYIGNMNLSSVFFTQEKFNFSVIDNGIFFSVIGLIAGVTQWFILPLVEKKLKDVKTIFLGGLLLITGQILVPVSTSVILFYSFFVITVLGSALLRPSVSSYISKRTKEGQGATMGLAFSFESLGRIIAPILLGFIITRFGSSIPFLITSFVVFVCLIPFLKAEVKILKRLFKSK